MSVLLSVHLSVCPSPSVYSSACLYFCLSFSSLCVLCLPGLLSVCSSVCLSFCAVNLSVSTSVYRHNLFLQIILSYTQVHFVHLVVPEAVLLERLTSRQEHYFPPQLLTSQLNSLGKILTEKNAKSDGRDMGSLKERGN